MAVGRAEVAAVQWGDLGFGLLKGGPGSVLQHSRELQIKEAMGTSWAHSNDSAILHAHINHIKLKRKLKLINLDKVK